MKKKMDITRRVFLGKAGAAVLTGSIAGLVAQDVSARHGRPKKHNNQDRNNHKHDERSDETSDDVVKKTQLTMNRIASVQMSGQQEERI